MRSTQKAQTLRLGRLRGPPSLRSDIDLVLLWAFYSEPSERDVVGIHVPDASSRVVGQRWQLFGGAARGRPGPAAVEELDVVGDDLGGPALLTVLALPRPGLQTPLDVHERAFLRVLRHQLGQCPRADVPGDDVVVVGELATVAVCALAIPVRGDAEGRDRLAARCVAHLGVLGKTADQHHLVQIAHPSTSSEAAAPTASSGAAGSRGSESASAGATGAASVAASDWALAAAPCEGGRLASGLRTIKWR